MYDVFYLRLTHFLKHDDTFDESNDWYPSSQGFLLGFYVALRFSSPFCSPSSAPFLEADSVFLLD